MFRWKLDKDNVIKGSIMKVIAIYPGRFQPFGPHHKQAYEWLAEQFGKENTFIVTSDKTDSDKSPLNFKEKSLIIQKSGINKKNIIQVKSPYRPIELLENFNEEETAVVFMYGAKDAGRLSYQKKDGSPGYFQKYNRSTALKTFNTHGYVIIAPHISLDLPNGKEISGTTLREFIPNSTPEEFKEFYGWYDEKIHNFLKSRFSKLNESNRTLTADVDDGPRFLYKDKNSYIKGTKKKPQVPEEWNIVDYLLGDSEVEIHNTDWPKGPPPSVSFFKIGNYGSGTDYFKDKKGETALNIWKQYVAKLIGLDNSVVDYLGADRKDRYITESENINFKDRTDTRILLTCGGAFGHLSHPFEEMDFTFKDLEELIEVSLTGEISLTGNVQEKLDGQNLMVTFINGQLLAARNMSTVNDPMTIEQLGQKFAGRGEIEIAFTGAMRDLENAFQKVNKNTLEKIFINGKRFLNMEVIFPGTKNVINYGDTAFLALLGVVEFDENFKPAKNLPELANSLQKVIKSVNAQQQDKFNIVAPEIIKIKKHFDSDNQINRFKTKLKQIQSSAGLSSNDTIYDYYEVHIRDIIDENFMITDELKDILVQRWVYNNKSVRLTKKNFGQYFDAVRDFEKNQLRSTLKEIKWPIEMLFLQLGIEVMKNVENFLSLSPNDAVQDIKDELETIINQIKSSGDTSLMQKFEENLRKFEALGGFDSIIPSEGIVFNYKGRLLKLTGSYAPVNQLLGLFRYSR